MNVTSRLSNRDIGIIVGLLAVILIAGGVCWWIRASRILSTDDARVKGTIVAVSAKVNGRIEKVLVSEGDNVRAGQVIVKLERQEFEAKMEQAKANLVMARAKLAATVVGNRPQEIAQTNAIVLQAKANMENSRKTNERDEVLYQKGAISIQQRMPVKRPMTSPTLNTFRRPSNIA